MFYSVKRFSWGIFGVKPQLNVLVGARICRLPVRRFADCQSASGKKGLVLGAYDGCSPGELKLTPVAIKYDSETGGKLREVLKGGVGIRRGTAQVFTNLHPDFYSVAVAGLGPERAGVNDLESLDECKENIRWASATGARALQDSGVTSVFVEEFTNAECAAEAAALAVWRYQEFKKKEDQLPNVKLEPYAIEDKDAWQRGLMKAEAQNLARRIEETPSNLMTPSIFSQLAVDVLCPCGIQIEVRDRDWLESKKFNALLTMAKGSCEEPLLLEIGYCGGEADDKPIVFVGKGITFDSGGLCLKDCENMSTYRADLAGAAVMIGLFRCIAMLALPINVKGLIPLCENMPGGWAVKPGDAVVGLNGKSVVIEDTDNEGRIIMLDPLAFTGLNPQQPCLVSSIASLTPGIKWAMGSAASGIWTTSHSVWREIQRAGSETGDRVWRFPFWKYYSKKVKSFLSVDVHNVGKGRGAGPCLGAAFIKEFAPTNVDLMHLDITGTGFQSTGVGFPYLRKGVMTGRPVRTLAQFLYQIACPHAKGDDC